jgi:ferredoxin-NADP reductase
MPTLTAPRRLLRSNLVDLLVGPHGIDRYLELIRPEGTVRDARARVLAVRRQTDRSVTLTLRPNAAWAGFKAGQFVRVGVEIEGVRRTRTYSPASSPYDRDGTLELTITEHPGGLVSPHLRSHIEPGAILHLSAAQGEFTLPAGRPERLVLISGGSGITPCLSILRTLCAEGHDGEVRFLHYARTAADWLYEEEAQDLARLHPNINVEYVATREGGGHLDPEAMAGHANATAAVCGPRRLIEAARRHHAGPIITESFAPPSLNTSGAAACGQLRFLRTGRTAAIAPGSLLEQAEAAGLSPDFGCRMGICRTCTCRKAAGTVRNVLTGEVSDEEDEDIQLCISVPAGDVALEI